MTLQDRGAKMYKQGYRYCVEIDGIEPLFVKSAMDVGPLMREYPDKKCIGYPINDQGTKVDTL